MNLVWTLDLSFNLMGLLVGSCPPYEFIGCFACYINIFFPLVVHARR